jgi:hypothetical protein
MTIPARKNIFSATENFGRRLLAWTATTLRVSRLGGDRSQKAIK